MYNNATGGNSMELAHVPALCLHRPSPMDQLAQSESSQCWELSKLRNSLTDVLEADSW